MLLIPRNNFSVKSGCFGMKLAVDLFQATSSGEAKDGRSEWTIRTVMRLVMAGVVLTAVCFFASSLPAPVEAVEEGGNLFGGFAMFWILGGIFTISLLALSDRHG